MHKLVIGITAAAALLLAGALAWNAEATTLTGAMTARPAANYSLVEKAGCWVPGDCDVGQHKVCNRFGNRCRCAPCPGWYPWREYKPAH